MNKISFYILTLLTIQGCTKDNTNSGELSVKFESLSSELTGINFNNKLESKTDLNIIEYLYYYNGGGVGILDVNNDGLDDIFFSGNEVGDELYLNEGDMKFKNITESAGINSEINWSTGVAIADVNNDGLVDIYVSTVSDYKNLRGHNRLYVNNGDLTFTEISKEIGLDFVGFGTQAQQESKDDNVKSIIQKALRKAFSPEFLNRIDDMIMFKSLGRKEIHQIIDIELKKLYERILSLGFNVTLTEKAKDFIVDNGYDEKFGARPLKRAIQKFVEDPLAEEIIKSNFKEGEKIKLDLNSAKDGLDVIHQKESKPKKSSTKKKDE